MSFTRILADTGPLYALADPDDQYHSRAKQELQSLQEGGAEILVLYPTLMEAYTLIMRYLGLGFAHTWMISVMDGTGNLNPTSKDYFESMSLVKKYSDQIITLFDAVVAVISRRLDVPIWTFDSDFDVMKSSVWRE